MPRVVSAEVVASRTFSAPAKYAVMSPEGISVSGSSTGARVPSARVKVVLPSRRSNMTGGRAVSSPPAMLNRKLMSSVLRTSPSSSRVTRWSPLPMVRALASGMRCWPTLAVKR